MQWLQDPNQSNVDNLNTVRHETSTHFRNKKKEYPKAKICGLDTNSKIKNITGLYRGTSDLKKGDQPRTNIVKDEKGDLVTDSHSIWAWWRNHFSQLLNVHGVNDVRETVIYTAEPLVPQSSAFEVQMAIEKLKRHTSPGTDQIPAEFIKAGGRTIQSEIHKLINSIRIRKNCLMNRWSQSLYLFIRKVTKQTVVIIKAYHFCQLHTKFYPGSCCQSLLLMQRKLMGIINMDLDATGQLLIIYSAFVKYLRKNGNTMKQCISYL